MSAHSLPINRDRAIRSGFYKINDPGASGTFSIINKDFAICHVVTAGAESRALPAVGGVEPGHRLLVVLHTAVGALSITGGEDGTSVLSSAGDIAEFVCVDKGGTKVWKNTIFDADLDTVEADIDTIEAYLERAVARTIIPLTDWRVHDAPATVLPAYADDDSDDLQINTPTIGTTAITLRAGVTNATVTKEAIAQVAIPHDYVAGSAISVVIPWTRSDAATTSATLDLTAFRVAAPTVDICATAAQDINAAASGTATFVLTPTALVPGEQILLNLLVAVVDGTTSNHELTDVRWSFTPSVIA